MRLESDQRQYTRRHSFQTSQLGLYLCRKKVPTLLRAKTWTLISLVMQISNEVIYLSWTFLSFNWTFHEKEKSIAIDISETVLSLKKKSLLSLCWPAAISWYFVPACNFYAGSKSLCRQRFKSWTANLVLVACSPIKAVKIPDSMPLEITL